MLTDMKIKNLKPRARPYKVADRDGLYVAITPGGVASFRYDYRVHDRRETLTIGRYDASRARELSRTLDDLEYGRDLSLAEARLLLTRARRSIEMGESPAKAKAEKKSRTTAEDTRYLSPAARSLYAGAKQTKDGIDVKLHDKSKHLELLMRHLGLLNDKLEVSGDLGDRILAARKRVRGH